jgi:hypothetical protein
MGAEHSVVGSLFTVVRDAFDVLSNEKTYGFGEAVAVCSGPLSAVAAVRAGCCVVPGRLKVSNLLTPFPPRADRATVRPTVGAVHSPSGHRERPEVRPDLPGGSPGP